MYTSSSSLGCALGSNTISPSVFLFLFHYSSQLHSFHNVLLVSKMAEDVINGMGNIKLTSDEEEDIQVSEEGLTDEIDSCVLSLIGKFLMCKPFNRKVAMNTLQKAWGLDKALQIAEVGSNLFQFKFQSEYEIDRILRGGPWTFDNQLLMLTRWRKGMSANNVVLEHASLWVQIWGVPFDMMSPKVAKEIGKKMGEVVDVERR